MKHKAMINERMRIIDITVGDFVQYLKEQGLVGTKEEKPVEIKYTGDDLVFGLDGLAGILGCSTRTAQRVKDSGKYKEAIKQNGRKIVTDVRKLITLMDN